MRQKKALSTFKGINDGTNGYKANKTTTVPGHLLVQDNDAGDVIPKSIQLIASRTGQDFNQRKNRKGAFWEDRYHYTAIETGEHFLQCLTYIDLNMVRAGVVRHPLDWPFGGYKKI